MAGYRCVRMVDVAVAVLQRDDGHVLLAQRPTGKPWAGWWEFPGGKIEAGEPPLAALQRELQEELGTQALEVYPWLTRNFDYPERSVKLHLFMVRRWSDTPTGRESQLLSWQSPAGLTVSPMLPANAPVLTALTLSPIYAITNLAEAGEQTFFRQLQTALDDGLTLIQLREKHLDATAFQVFAERVLHMTKTYAAKVMINSAHLPAGSSLTSAAAWSGAMGADGIHLSTQQLMAMQERPAGILCGASCHDAVELAHAKQLQLDFVVLAPVLGTLSHPGVVPLGWPYFAQLIADYPLPVYALGGLQRHELVNAWQHGAHGIAMQRGAWR